MSKRYNVFRFCLLCFALAIVSFSFSACKKVEWPEYMLSLEYEENFKIMQLADIQSSSVESCNNAFINIKKLVEKEKPNLIVLTGDNIDAHSSEDVFYSLIDNMESLETPWAPVFGNHDAEGSLTKEFMAEKFIEAEHCLFYSGEDGVDGVGNYVVNLTRKGKIMYSLFLIDSNMYHEDETTTETIYDTIHANQVEWYERAVNKLTEINGKKVVKSLAFFHIPLCEFQDAKDSYDRGESTGYVDMHEGIYPGFENTGLFEKALELKSTIAFVCGHDHANNCDILYKGIHMIYGLKSSQNSYYDSALLGANILTLNKEGLKFRAAHFE